MFRIAILGAGTWGIALAKLLSNAGQSVTVWSAIKEEIEQLSITRKHKNLPYVDIPKTIYFNSDLNCVCTNNEIIIFAIPSIYVLKVATQASPFLTSHHIIVSAVKGIDSMTLKTMSEIISTVIPQTQVVVLSGPTHAEEVAIGLPSAIVVAHKNISLAEKIQRIISSPVMRVYTNIDVKGVELCGALKNIIALAAGIATGLGYCDNTKAALITRGLAEIKNLGLRMDCLADTFNGLAGMGDFIVTATSKHSRNNRCGYLIGQGYTTLDAVKRIGMVVEGINAIPAAVALSKKYEVELPIVFSVEKVINQKADPREIVEELMDRSYKTELVKPIMDSAYEKAEAINPSFQVKGEQRMKRVITYGTFDLLHYGHINLLRRAKALGDYLIVVISSDEFNWNEKHKKCYFTYEQRKALVESIRYVDLVIPEENWNQKRTDMHEYHIDTFVMGDDWKGKFDFLREEGVEVIYLPRTPEISSSKMKKDLYDANSVDGESTINHDDINTDPV